LFPDYEGISFRSLNIVDKIQLLKAIQDLHVESTDEKFIAFKNEKEAENLESIVVVSYNREMTGTDTFCKIENRTIRI
jgi:hypothetical protein